MPSTGGGDVAYGHTEEILRRTAQATTRGEKASELLANCSRVPCLFLPALGKGRADGVGVPAYSSTA